MKAEVSKILEGMLEAALDAATREIRAERDELRGLLTASDQIDRLLGLLNDARAVAEEAVCVLEEAQIVLHEARRSRLPDAAERLLDGAGFRLYRAIKAARERMQWK